jgi:hypothetical protein
VSVPYALAVARVDGVGPTRVRSRRRLGPVEGRTDDGAGCTAMPPPSARTRFKFRSVIVSAWSKNQRSPSKGMSRLTASNTSRKRPIGSS